MEMILYSGGVVWERRPERNEGLAARRACFTRRTALAVPLAVALLVGCAPPHAATSGGAGGIPPEAVHGINLPAGGAVLLFVGQDADATFAYRIETGLEPRGVVGYTALPALGGLTEDSDAGGTGRQNLQQVVTGFPDAGVAVGLYLVGQTEAIAAGSQDAAIDHLVDILVAFGRRVWVRIGYEFDQPSNAYDPASYVAAYRRIVARMRARAPDTLASVWQTSAHCGSPAGDFERWYPGDDAVDWIGLSYFQQGACDFLPLLDVVYFARRKAKPVMIAESAPQGYDLGRHTFSSDGKTFVPVAGGQIWDRWFTPWLDFVRDTRDVVRAVAYIDSHWDAHPAWASGRYGYWGDSRVQADPEILSRWRSALAGAPFGDP